MRNRADVLSRSLDRDGVRCDWKFSRPLHLCTVFPITGRWLLNRALQACPIRVKDFPLDTSPDEVVPNVSFILGHRGLARLPLLLMTIKSIAAQEDISVECIVVEQDVKPLIRNSLPSWVRYFHAPLMGADQPYNRARAFNDGVRLAQGEVLILHDNDLLVPACYALRAFDLFKKGYEVSQLKRFIFYVNKTSTRNTMVIKNIPKNMRCEQVVENSCGGGSLALSKKAYWDIGGMDEDFVGWGGEDNEFWDRCLTRKVWEYASLPIIHLWHVSLSNRQRETNPMMTLLDEKLGVPAQSRIQTLRGRLR